MTKRGGFPAPEVELASGRVWKREAVEKWAEKAGRELRFKEGGKGPEPNRLKPLGPSGLGMTRPINKP